MISYNGAETCQLIGIYLLNLLTTEMNLECNLGLYREDGLIVCEGTPRHIEQNNKKISAFSENLISQLQ